MARFLVTVGLTYFSIAFVLTVVFVKFLKKHFLGSFFLAFVVALVGTAVGGMVDSLFGEQIAAWSMVGGVTNIWPSVVSSYLLLRVFSYVSSQKSED